METRVFRRREAIDPLLEQRRRDVRPGLGDMDGDLSGGGAQVSVTVRRRHLQLEQAWERRRAFHRDIGISILVLLQNVTSGNVNITKRYCY